MVNVVSSLYNSSSADLCVLTVLHCAMPCCAVQVNRLMGILINSNTCLLACVR